MQHKIEQNERENEEEKINTQKKNQFREKGRGKSTIIANKNNSNTDNYFTGRLTDVGNFQTNNGQQESEFNGFSQLHRHFKNVSVSKGQRRYRSVVNFDDEISQEASDIDFKVQELNRRNNMINSESQADGEQVAEQEGSYVSLDKEYYNFLHEVNQEQKNSGVQIDTDKQSFLQHKQEKESGKEWYKMIRNLRFKIHYNHYHTNLKKTLSCGFWGDIKDQLRQEFHIREEHDAVEAEFEQEFSAHFNKKNIRASKKEKSPQVSRSQILSVEKDAEFEFKDEKIQETQNDFIPKRSAM